MLVAWPVSRMISNAVGQQFLNAPLRYEFSTAGMALWLAVVFVLSAVASYLPARKAARLTVQEVLAYE
jgi:putative ABC transport system permease protein